MKTNVPTRAVAPRTHEGAVADRIGAAKQLRRSVMSCMLWESEFYEGGQAIGERIAALVPQVEPETVAQIAVEARERMKLRHVPLWIVRSMAHLPKHKSLVADTLDAVIQRPDELTEFLALYWKDGRQPLSAQVKKGLARAFGKFNEYQLAKYNRDGIVKLRDVLFLSHAKPRPGTGKLTKLQREGIEPRVLSEREKLYSRVANNTLEVPDTWEVALSTGQNKKETFTRLIAEGKLGALALLRNLRGMLEAGVSRSDIEGALANCNTERVLPFRFVAAAKHAPSLEPAIERAMLRCVAEQPPLPGRTALLVDSSRSMTSLLSDKSELTRFDAATALGIILRGICEQLRVFSFSSDCVEVPARSGFALRDAIMASMKPEWTLLGRAVRYVYHSYPECDRLIVITDEQSADRPPAPHGRGYIINVASAENGIGYHQWTHIDGWSEGVIDYIREAETA